MNVLVLGAGAMGGYYGSRLIQAGVDVTFMVREARAKTLEKNGLRVHSPLGSFDGKVNTVTTGSGPASRPFDLIFLACKAYDLDGAMDAIEPHVSDRTCVVPVLNGLRAYDKLDQRFGRHRVMGGVSYIATSLTDDGEIVHASKLDRLVIGARHEEQRPLARELVELFSKSDGLRVLSDEIEQDLWEKWIALCAGASATCLMRASIGEILATQDGRQVIERTLDECIGVAIASGRAPRDSAKAAMNGMLFDPQSNWKASMLRDIEIQTKKIEADDIVGDMLSRAALFGLDARLLTLAYVHLQAYERHRGANN